MRALVAAVVVAVATPCAAQSTLRIATIAPDGTMWARVLHDWQSAVERESKGAVRIKLYFGGIAGDELSIGDRIHRGQLDGLVSAGSFCEKVAPSLRVMRVLGLFQNRDEAGYVMNRLKPTFDKEALAAGYVNVADAGLGSIILFSRKPVSSMAELRRTTFWTGMQDPLTPAQLGAIGVHALPERMAQATADYASGRIDGFLTTPSVALAYQWSSQANYFSDLRIAFMFGCLVIANGSLDALPVEAQQAVHGAAAQALIRLGELGRQQDDALIHGLFERQGLKEVRVDERFRTEFYEAAQTARDRLSEALVPAALLRQVQATLADYRGQHGRVR